MWEWLYSDSQLQEMRHEARQQVANARQPLHPDYGDRVKLAQAQETVREVDEAVAKRCSRTTSPG